MYSWFEPSPTLFNYQNVSCKRIVLKNPCIDITQLPYHEDYPTWTTFVCVYMYWHIKSHIISVSQWQLTGSNSLSPSLSMSLPHSLLFSTLRSHIFLDLTPYLCSYYSLHCGPPEECSIFSFGFRGFSNNIQKEANGNAPISTSTWHSECITNSHYNFLLNIVYDIMSW